MTFTTVEIADLPKTNAGRPLSPENQATRDALMAVLETGKAAQGGVQADEKANTNEVNRLRRLVLPVVPDGKRLRSRSFAVDGGYSFAFWLADKPAPKGKSKGK